MTLHSLGNRERPGDPFREVTKAPGVVIEKFTNPARGTWTLLRTIAGGKSCLVREGRYRPGPVEVAL
jgi:hypothetical protein